MNALAVAALDGSGRTVEAATDGRAAIPEPEDVRRCSGRGRARRPGIEHDDAAIREVPGVPGRDRGVSRPGDGGDLAIGLQDRPPGERRGAAWALGGGAYRGQVRFASASASRNRSTIHANAGASPRIMSRMAR